MSKPITLRGFRVEGRHASQFLQGKLTADLSALTYGQWTHAAYCSIKGKVLVNLRVAHCGTHFLLLTSTALNEPIRQHLQRFTLHQDVSLHPDVRTVFYLPPTLQQSRTIQFVSENRLCLHDNAGPSLWIGEAPEQAPLDDNSAANYLIQAGIAQITPATADQFLPQMLDMERLGGLSFRKGCYIGQEVIARTQYKAPIRRHLSRLQGKNATLPEPGSSLVADETSVGVVILSAREGKKNHLLAVVQDRFRKHTLLDRQTGNAYRLISPSFTTPEADT